MYDVVIIGAGVTGSAVARELSRYQASVLVLEREEDVCCGTSKANSGIIHAGFDAQPGSNKAYFNVRGSRMMETLSKELDFPYRRNTSLVIRNRRQNAAVLRELLASGEQNGVEGLRILSREELLRREPHVNEDAVEALLAPTGAIVCPFKMTIAFAENACVNGVEFRFDTKVASIEKTGDGYLLHTETRSPSLSGSPAASGSASGIPAAVVFGQIHTRAVVNCAGVYADVFHNMVSEDTRQITPRRGQYYILDKTVGNYVNATLFQLPGPMGKGVLVSPTVHGNLLVGPTAEDIEDKEGVETTADGLARLRTQAALNMKDLPLRQAITSFSGLRATEKDGDFVIGEPDDAPLFFDAVGIESPGLSSAPAIGEYLAGQIRDRLSLKEKPDFHAERKDILDPKTLSLKECTRLIKEQPAYGRIVC